VRSNEVRHDHDWDNAKQAVVDYMKFGESAPQVAQRSGTFTSAAGHAVVEGENPVKAAQDASQAAKKAHEQDNRGQGSSPPSISPSFLRFLPHIHSYSNTILRY